MSLELPKLVLTGGLGNQLFQYAYALDRYGPGKFAIRGLVGNPRLNQSGLPEIFSFNITEGIDQKISKTTLMSKFAVRNSLRLSSHGRDDILGKSLFRGVDLTGRFLGKFGLSWRVHLGEGTGYFESKEDTIAMETVIGCFHSYVWASKVSTRSLLRSMKLINKPNWLSVLEQEASEISPVIVHVRRSDYTQISELGFVKLDYYWTQMRDLLRNQPATKFWLFSDDFKEVLRTMPTDLIQKTKCIDFDQDNAAANLMAMRLGREYILSNSTFSWWGAFLSYSGSPTVRIPSRWYKTGASPAKIYPPTWELVEVE